MLTKNDGELTFGGLDTSKFDQKTLTTIQNINLGGFWEVPIDKMDKISISSAALQSLIRALSY